MVIKEGANFLSAVSPLDVVVLSDSEPEDVTMQDTTGVEVELSGTDIGSKSQILAVGITGSALGKVAVGDKGHVAEVENVAFDTFYADTNRVTGPNGRWRIVPTYKLYIVKNADYEHTWNVALDVNVSQEHSHTALKVALIGSMLILMSPTYYLWLKIVNSAKFDTEQTFAGYLPSKDTLFIRVHLITEPMGPA